MSRHRSHPFVFQRRGLAASVLLAAPVLLTAPLALAAQENEGASASLDALPAVPRLVVDGVLPSGPVEAPQAGIDRGLPRIEPAHFADDLPLPQRAVYAPGDLADELVAEGSGDPFFLGFSAGPYRPPAGERVDPALVDRIFSGSTDGRPEPVTYAYVMLNKRVNAARMAELEAAGARVIAFRPHQAFSVALTDAALAQLTDHPAVHWLGFARPWQKLHPALAESLQNVAPGERVPMIVSVFDDDRGAEAVVQAVAATEVAGPDVRRTEQARGQRWTSNGWQQAELQALGLEVVEYLPNIRAFRVQASPEDALALVERDFVEFVEPELPSLPMHDDSMPMLGADYVRATYDGDWSGEAIAGEIDSGVDIAHSALNHAWYLGWSLTGQSAWSDTCPHGSHVAGTIIGSPSAPLGELSGAAPGLGDTLNRAFRNVKFMEKNPNPGNNCIGVGGSSLEQRFSLMRDDWSDGQTTAPPPHVINNSWGTGATNGGWIGSEANSREVDEEVWNENQVYVFAAGNSGPGASTLGQEASAKNAITVGNVVPYQSLSSGAPGSLWLGGSASSIGPTGDNRWKPNLVAPGTSIVSVTANTGNGFNAGTGTSMASPHVTGVVAQLVDHHAFLRYRPERVASLVMATALTKADATLSSPSASHLDTYGAGRIDAYRANYTDSQHGWLNWGFGLGSSDQAWDEFTVSDSVERVVVVMHYIEPASGGGASQALVNDFDLVLDYAPFSAPIDQGDYLAQQSSINNTEIRAVNNPTPGTWRWKVHPVSASTNVKMSVTVHFIYGDTTPSGSLAVGADDVFVKPGEDVVVTATVGNTEHVASAVLLNVTGTEGANLLAATTELLDGQLADLTDNPNNNGGWQATVGNVRHGWTREVDWTVDWASEGVKTFSVDADSDNGMNRSASVDVTVDGTGPGIPVNLQSSSHFTNQWYSQDDVHFVWNHAPDNLSGIAGYGVFVSHGTGAPGPTMDLGATTLTSEVMATSSQGWYFSLRAVDKSGNWSASHATAGPYFIDTVDPATVTGLVSTSHLTGTWTNDAEIDVQWIPATDAHSGVAGYGVFWSNGGPNAPSNVQDLGAVTSTSETFGSSSIERWFNIRTVDEAGNWDAEYTSAGPFLVDVTPPTVGAPTFWNEVSQITSTTSTSVIVSIGASDLHSGLSQMRLRNEGGSFGPWVPYAPTTNWNLTSYGGSTATGTKHVDVQVRDLAGNVNTSALGSIYYYRPATTFGSACAGSLGAPGVYTKQIAAPGVDLSVVVNNTDAVVRRLMLGFSAKQWSGFELPLSLAPWGSPGCELLVSQDLELYNGPGSVAVIKVPDNQALVGTTVYLQWQLYGDSSGLPVITTEGLEVYINGN
ncbi:S8 family serine peptidase [Engelhardtia mirabilis]|uniref:Thermophilic serine proteinase n=1 Tax=Engelhardtia mirabilis TaxID=2528011 RepID=A0A518BRZ8_9BACT|nr:Thermophilic serine proteinase precursor [Planctomycetes bacterium Pla133]QDV04074.1 Thermophilic serine proteinase precursor [Planctomycetes bacterium Pla86]